MLEFYVRHKPGEYGACPTSHLEGWQLREVVLAMDLIGAVKLMRGWFPHWSLAEAKNVADSLRAMRPCCETCKRPL